jgi:putative molybdopterin biosynthesis protein
MSVTKARARTRDRGQRVAEARSRAEISQEALADRIGVTRLTIIRIEGGTRPSVDVALAIARELGESVEDLFGGER